MQHLHDIVYWLALRQIPGLGPVFLRQQWNKLGDVSEMWEELNQAHTDAATYLDTARLEIEAAEKQNIQILTLSNPDFPSQLRNIPDIPPILYVKGQLGPQNSRTAGVVGTRFPSRYGAEATQRLTRQLVAEQYTIISGMAKGVDSIAHRSAIEAGGQTIAVWGSGLDCACPPEQVALAEQIVKHGAIVSQFPLGTQAQSFTFPVRNKVIAGLSQVIIVTEAKAKSGSLLTAQAGVKYGRKVGAVPGSIYSIGSAGTHELIKNGNAQLVVDAADIVDTIAATKPARHQNHPPAIPVTAPEQAVLDQLQSGPQHVDELIRQAAQPASKIVSTLAMLEIKGLVKQLAPGEYLKN